MQCAKGDGNVQAAVGYVSGSNTAGDPQLKLGSEIQQLWAAGHRKCSAQALVMMAGYLLQIGIGGQMQTHANNLRSNLRALLLYEVYLGQDNNNQDWYDQVADADADVKVAGCFWHFLLNGFGCPLVEGTKALDLVAWKHVGSCMASKKAFITKLQAWAMQVNLDEAHRLHTCTAQQAWSMCCGDVVAYPGTEGAKEGVGGWLKHILTELGLIALYNLPESPAHTLHTCTSPDVPSGSVHPTPVRTLFSPASVQSQSENARTEVNAKRRRSCMSADGDSTMGGVAQGGSRARMGAGGRADRGSRERRGSGSGIKIDGRRMNQVLAVYQYLIPHHPTEHVPHSLRALWDEVEVMHTHHELENPGPASSVHHRH